MEPKGGFINKGPYKGSFTMHVSSPLRIGKNCHSRKEAFHGAADDDASSGMVLVAATSLFF